MKGNFKRCIGKLITLTLALLLQSDFVSAVPFEEIIDLEEAKTESTLSSEDWGPFKEKHVIFVDGVMNELAALAGNYFQDSITELKRLGISYSHLRYSTRSSVPENASQLYLDLEEIYKKSQKPIVLIGHSKGGANSLYCILEHPDLLASGRVERVVLINAAIGGSILVNHLGRDPCSQLLGCCMGRGLKTLSPEKCHHNFQQAFEYFMENIQSFPNTSFDKLSEKVFYLRTFLNSEKKPSLGVRIVQFFSDKKKIQGPNDGILTLDNQTLRSDPKFGKDLAVLEGDHIELAVSGSFSGSNSKRRRALTRALLKKLYETSEEQVELQLF